MSILADVCTWLRILLAPVFAWVLADAGGGIGGTAFALCVWRW